MAITYGQFMLRNLSATDVTEALQKKVKSGDVFMLVPNLLVSRERPDLNTFFKHLFDSLWIEFETKDQSINCLINFLSYCPAKNMMKQYLEELERGIDLGIIEKNS